MKYLIKYQRGNGETCHCHSDWRDDIEEIGDYENAVKYVFDLKMADSGIRRFDGIVPIPESPDEFIKEDDVWDESGFRWSVNFNEDDFLEDVDKLIKQEELAEQKRKQELEQIAAEQKLKQQKLENKRKEIAERAEFERLKAKFGAA